MNWIACPILQNAYLDSIAMPTFMLYTFQCVVSSHDKQFKNSQLSWRNLSPVILKGIQKDLGDYFGQIIPI